jgi:hypothetical protein
MEYEFSGEDNKLRIFLFKKILVGRRELSLQSKNDRMYPFIPA